MEDVQKLLFAAEVRKLAFSILEGEVERYRRTILDDPEFHKKMMEYDSSLFVESFLEDAYNRIVNASEKIDGFEKARLAKKLEGNRFAAMRQQQPSGD